MDGGLQKEGAPFYHTFESIGAMSMAVKTAEERCMILSSY